MYTVYKLTFPNGKIYIGQTKKSLAQRWQNGNGYKRCPKICTALQKYSWDTVIKESLAIDLTKMEADTLEFCYIRYYNSIEDGYNTALPMPWASIIYRFASIDKVIQVLEYFKKYHSFDNFNNEG